MCIFPPVARVEPNKLNGMIGISNLPEAPEVMEALDRRQMDAVSHYKMSESHLSRNTHLLVVRNQKPLDGFLKPRVEMF
jgi:hypothetical protein